MLSAEQYRAIDMLIDDNKLHKEIAKEIGIAPETLSRWKKDKEFEDEYIKLLRQAFAHIAPKAKKKMIQLMDCGNPSVEYSATKDVLDRAGLKAVEKAEVDNKNINLNQDITNLSSDERKKRIEELLKKRDSVD